MEREREGELLLNELMDRQSEIKTAAKKLKRHKIRVSRKSYHKVVKFRSKLNIRKRERGGKVEDRGRKGKEGDIERKEEENGKEKGWSERRR